MNNGPGSLVTPAEPSEKTLPANDSRRSVSVNSISPSARSTSEVREKEGSSQRNHLVISPPRPSPSAHFYHRKAANVHHTPSPPRRFIPSSPLPPSSPPQDTSPSPPRHVDEDEPISLGLDSSPRRVFDEDGSDNRHIVETISSRQSNRSDPNSTHSSPVENAPRPTQGFLLREPDSGDSVYSNGDNFYRGPPSDDSVNPAQMCDETYQDFIRCTQSLSKEIRSLIGYGAADVHAAHSAERDAILNRRKACQERQNFWRMHLYLAGFTNPAKKWSRQAIWKGPIDLILVNGEYVEVSSDDPRIEVEAPSSNFGWSTDEESTNNARAPSDEETPEKDEMSSPRNPQAPPVVGYNTVVNRSRAKHRASSEESS